MAIDTHSHIFDEAFSTDLEEVINRIIEANISKALVVGFSKETNELALELAKKHAFLYPTIGYHPSEAAITTDDDLILLEKQILSDKQLIYN